MEFFHTLATYSATWQAWLMALLVAHPLAAGLMLAAIAAGFATPVLGNVVPGASLFVAAGGLVAAGKLSLVIVLLGGLLGTLAGDALFYQLGYYHRQEIWHWHFWQRYPGVISRGRALFAKYGSWAVVFGRFVPGVHTFVTLLAGATAVPPRRFYPASLVGALLWAPPQILVGFYALKALL